MYLLADTFFYRRAGILLVFLLALVVLAILLAIYMHLGAISGTGPLLAPTAVEYAVM